MKVWTRQEWQEKSGRNLYNNRKANTLTPPTTQPTMKIINQNDPPQHRSSTHSNDTSTASCALQTDEGNVAKEFILDPTYSSDII